MVSEEYAFAAIFPDTTIIVLSISNQNSWSYVLQTFGTSTIFDFWLFYIGKHFSKRMQKNF